MSSWYLARNKKKVGPFSMAKLKEMADAGQLTRRDHLLREGTKKWLDASDVPGLFDDETAAKQPPQKLPKKVLVPPSGKKFWLGVGAGVGGALLLVFLAFLLFGGRKDLNDTPPDPLVESTDKKSDPRYKETRPTGDPKVKTPSENPKPEPKRPELARNAFRVTGSAKMDPIERMDSIGGKQLRYTINQVRLNVVINNSLDQPIKLGNTLMFVEMDDSEQMEGILAGFRLPDEPDIAKESDRWYYKMAYGVTTIESRYANGRRFTFVGPVRSFDLLTVINNTRWQDDSRADKIPTDLAARGMTNLTATFNRMYWIKDDARQTVRVALPELILPDSARYRLIATCKKADAKTWEVAETDLVPLSPAALEPVVSQAKTSLDKAVLATNWWAETDAKTAFPALARQADSLSGGRLLHTILLLSSRYKDPNCRPRARALLSAAATKLDVTVAAASYLAALGEDPDVSTLINAARGPNDEQAAAVIFSLGQLKTPGAITGLRRLLDDTSIKQRHAQINANLALAEKPPGKGPKETLPRQDGTVKPATIQFDSRYHRFRIGFSPDSKSLLALSIFKGGTVEAGGMKITLPPLGGGELFHAHSGARIKKNVFETRFKDTFFDDIRGHAFAPDGNTLAIAGGHMVGLFDLQSGKLLREFGPRNDTRAPLVFTAGGKELLTNRIGNKVSRWDPLSGKELDALSLTDLDRADSRVFSPDGKKLAGGWKYKMIKWWDLAVPGKVYDLPGHEQIITSLAFSPDGKTLASGSVGGAKVWDLASNTKRAVLGGKSFHVAFSPNGRWIATGGEYAAKIWDASSLKELATVLPPKRADKFVNGVAFSPDSATLAIWDGDNFLYPDKSAVRITLWPMERVLQAP